MPVIAVASTKGGPGKTTLALCLAQWLAQRGLSVECLDTDPNQNLTTWMDTAGNPLPCKSIGEDEVVEEVADAAERADVVIVDVAGGLAKALIYSLSVADLVLLPTRPDAKDAGEAIKTYAHVERARKTTRRHIEARAVMMQVNRRARVTSHSAEQLVEAGVPVLEAVVPHRTGYQGASYTGRPLQDRDVAADIGVVATEILQVLGIDHG